MFCQNCGNKLNEEHYFCENCGYVLKKRTEMKKKYNLELSGILSTVLGSISILLSFILFFHDISSAGMYTEIYERIFFALEYSLFAILSASLTLILSLIGKKSIYNTIGFVLSLISFFFIISEFIVVIVY